MYSFIHLLHTYLRTYIYIYIYIVYMYIYIYVYVYIYIYTCIHNIYLNTHCVMIQRCCHPAARIRNQTASTHEQQTNDEECNDGKQ